MVPMTSSGGLAWPSACLPQLSTGPLKKSRLSAGPPKPRPPRVEGMKTTGPRGLEIRHDLYLGDCEQILKQIPADSVDLIFTSPPYADQRKKTYGGIHPDNYADWFLPKAAQMLRVLKPTGTFILNIKEKVVSGERSTYVMELVLAMRKQGWLWTEEFIWHKKNCYPGKWPNRFRDAWERLLQFNKHKKFNMYQEEVMAPMGDWARTRLKRLSETDKKKRRIKGWQRLRQKHIQLAAKGQSLPHKCFESGHGVQQ